MALRHEIFNRNARFTYATEHTRLSLWFSPHCDQDGAKRFENARHCLEIAAPSEASAVGLVRIDARRTLRLC
jgi:hypothetical protein